MPPENFEAYQQFLAERNKVRPVDSMLAGNSDVAVTQSAGNGGRMMGFIAALFFLAAGEGALVFALPYAGAWIPMVMLMFAVFMFVMMGKLLKSP
jgi:hypothetical protein